MALSVSLESLFLSGLSFVVIVFVCSHILFTRLKTTFIELLSFC